MSSQTRLNGSKVLKGAASLTLLLDPDQGEGPLRLSRAVADAEINLPYVTLVREGAHWIVTLSVDGPDKTRIHALLDEGKSWRILGRESRCMVLSLFPHQSNPRVPALLFEAFGKSGVEVQGAANSPSALSLLLRQDLLDEVSALLFETFQFSSYRTPGEWKAAQEGKEVLYKEVVASYQEKQPKVYGLTCFENQLFVSGFTSEKTLVSAGAALHEAATAGLRLNFFTACPSAAGGMKVLYCLPARTIEETAPPSPAHTPAAVFTMNGPHFGDRYGIASELLEAFHKRGIGLLALNCTVASITGAVGASDLEPAIEAVQTCFEVPSVIRA